MTRKNLILLLIVALVAVGALAVKLIFFNLSELDSEAREQLTVVEPGADNNPILTSQDNRLPAGQADLGNSENKLAEATDNAVNQRKIEPGVDQLDLSQPVNQGVDGSLGLADQGQPSTASQNQAASETNGTASQSPGYHQAMTTYFWVGEEASQDNSYIANSQSYWDENWLEHFGGVDDPADRCGYLPCAFRPKENPFYFALPYGDYDKDGNLKASVKQIPWHQESDNGQSILKNYWIEIKYNSNICYAQWEDVGPYETDDFAYVFGNQPARNKIGVGAGLDLSPAVRDCLGLGNNDFTEWKFIAADQVPAGPWREIVTR